MGANCSSEDSVTVIKMGLDVYYFTASQPSRTVVMFLKCNKIEFDLHVINVLKGETRTPEYLALNPLHTVPMINSDGFKLCQSVSEVKYLAGLHKVADHWYPADLKKRAKIDEVLDWHHGGIRAGGCGVFRGVILYPLTGGPEMTSDETDEKYKALNESLDYMENCLLKDQQFLCGNAVSIADIFCANEVFQATLCGRDIYVNYPKVKSWMECVREKLNPVWDEVIGEFEETLKMAQNKH